MIAIRQFVESLALGLGVGLVLVLCAHFILESEGPVQLESGSRAVSSPAQPPALRRDEDGVPLPAEERPEQRDARAG